MPQVQGVDPTKIELPCAHCKAILNVPYGLARFRCPQCDTDLTVDLIPSSSIPSTSTPRYLMASMASLSSSH
ncbi:hypothetical protein GUJ93_ZPchr0014g47248 [Zizania palustris]|uniref:FORGETTER1 second zinc ribbon domain-containing protein n=1 Tax=Zizania palustris TaxID=103762 RepID=A0A8J5SWG3_ZIZPA|nr:hypothetical protein GUJ93_ZPchr0014g47248 [Zizania palustris]